MLYAIYLWVDLIWLPVIFFTVHKKHRWLAAGFAVTCMIMMRLQRELMESIHHPDGILPVFGRPVNLTLLITYSVFYVIFIGIAHYSAKTEGIVFMGTCLAVFFVVFVTSSLVMLL